MRWELPHLALNIQRDSEFRCSGAENKKSDRYVQIRNWTGEWMKKACHILTHAKLFVWMNVTPYCIIRNQYVKCIINLVLWWFLVKIACGWRIHCTILSHTLTRSYWFNAKAYNLEALLLYRNIFFVHLLLQLTIRLCIRQKVRCSLEF